MTGSRTLPKRLNPLLQMENTPLFHVLVSRRRLGQTYLNVKPNQVGTSNATQPENLGMFEYAHLRVPLPRDLKGSGIFPSTNPYPESYFLMRRSSDGYISATGMYKAAFPWAKLNEEVKEREYVKGLAGASQDEVAGNIWIEPETALRLAQDYGIEMWIQALLDPQPIIAGNDSKSSIAPPPQFDLSNAPASLHLSPSLSSPNTPSARGRSRNHAASPSKQSPKKRPTRALREVNLRAAQAANDVLQDKLKDTPADESDAAAVEDAEAVEVKEAEVEEKSKRSSRRRTRAMEKEEIEKEKEKQKEKEKGKEKEKQKEKQKEETSTHSVIEINTEDEVEPVAEAEPVESVSKEDEAAAESQESTSPETDGHETTVIVESSRTVEGDVETENTSVSVTLPDDTSGLPPPQSTEELIETAKKMVEDAKALEKKNEALSIRTKGTKRKADSISQGDEDEGEADADAANADSADEQKRKVRVLEEKLQRERLRTRALLGAAGVFAVGASLPYFF